MMRPRSVDDTATTPIDPAVVAAMEPYGRAAFGNPSREHAYGVAVRHVVTERVGPPSSCHALLYTNLAMNTRRRPSAS